MILLLLQNYHNIITISAITFIHILLLNIITIITNLIITSSFRSFNISDNILRYLASQRKPQDFCFCILLVCVFLSLFSFAAVQDRYLSPVAVTVILSHWIKLVSSDFIVMVLVFGIFLFSLCSFWNFSFLIIFPPLFCFF